MPVDRSYCLGIAFVVIVLKVTMLSESEFFCSFEDMLTRFANFHMHHDRSKYTRYALCLEFSLCVVLLQPVRFDQVLTF